MPPTVLRELTGRSSRFQPELQQFDFVEWLAGASFLVIFAGVGLYLWLQLREPGNPGMSRLGIVVFPLLLAVLAARSFATLLRGRAEWRRRLGEWRESGEAWRLDGRWDHERVGSDLSGFRGRWLGSWFQAIAAGTMVALMISLWQGHQLSLPLVLGVVVPLVVNLFPKELLPWLRFGDSQLFFNRFPFFLGDDLPFRLRGLDPVRGTRSIEVTLRCIQEGFRGNGQRRVLSVLHEETRLLDPRTVALDEMPVAGTVRIGAGTGERRALRFEFRLPADPAFETQLTGQLPRYWELEVTAERPFLDYRALFLLPVYARQNATIPAGEMT